MKRSRYNNLKKSSNKNIRRSNRKQMGGMQRIFNQKTFDETWESGSTMWIVYGDGIRVFMKSKYEDKLKLFTELKPFIENKKQYEVFAN